MIRIDSIPVRRHPNRVGVFLFVVLALTTLIVAATGCTSGEEIPDLERRAQELNRSIMCPVCPGESIDQSQNPRSVQMRGIIMTKLEEGSTGEEIKAFFKERYGPSVLLEPPQEGFSLAIWLLPPLALLGGGLALYSAIRMMRRSPAPEPRETQEEVRLTDEERDEYLRRIDAALDIEGIGGGNSGSDDTAAPKA